MRSPISQDSDGDLASALKDIKVRLDGLDRLGRPPSRGPPTSLTEHGPSSIPPQIARSPIPFPSPPIQDGQQAKTEDGIPTRFPSVTPGTYTNNNWIAAKNPRAQRRYKALWATQPLQHLTSTVLTGEPWSGGGWPTTALHCVGAIQRRRLIS